MPIFEFDGTSYDVEDRYIDKFAAKYPDAVAYDSINGKRYRVKPGKWKKFAEKKATEEGLMSSLSKHVGPETIAQGRKMLGLDEPKPKKVESYASKAMNTDVEGLNADGSRDVKYRLPNGKIELNKGEHEVRNLLGESFAKKVLGDNSEQMEREYRRINDALEYQANNRYDVDKQLTRVENVLQSRLDKQNYSNRYATMGGGYVGNMDTGYSRMSEDDKNMLQARELLLDTKAVKKSGENHKQGLWGDVKDANRTFWNTITDFDTWDAGLKGTDEGKRLLAILDKAEAEEPLTNSEEMLLDAWLTNTMTQVATEAGAGRVIGQTVGQMAPFVLEMMMNPATGIGKGLTRKLMRKVGNQISKRFLRRATATGARLATDAVGAGVMAGTTGVGHVMSGAYDRMVQDPSISFGEALGTSYADRTIENWSEMFGSGMLSPLSSKASAWATRAARKGGESGLGRWMSKGVELTNRIKNTKVAQGLKKFNEISHREGSVEEYLEEVVGNSTRAALGLDGMEFSTEKGKGVFNLEDNVVTFLAVAVPGVARAAINTAWYAGANAYTKRQLNKANEQGTNIFGEEWGQIRNIIDNIDFDNPYQVGLVMSGLNTTDENQAKAIADYAKAKGMRRGFDSASNEVLQDNTEQAEAEGSTAETPDEVRNVGMSMDEAEQALLGTADGQNIKDALDRYVESGSTDVAQANAVLSGVSDDVRPIAEAYFMARVRTQAYADKKIDEVDAIVKAEEEKLAPYIYGGEEELQYDADGNIVRDEKGNAVEVTTPRMFAKMTIEDVEENQTTVYLHKYDPESNTLYYINEATGKVESMMRNDPRIVSLEEVDYDTYIEQVRADAQKKIADEANGMLNHSPKTNKVMKIGDVIHTAQGQMMVMSNADGQVQLLPAVMTKEGMMQAQQGEPVTVSMDDAMRMQDEYYEAKPVEAEAPVVESETQTSETEAPKAEAPKASPIPLVEDGKNKRVAYEQVPVERTVEEIVGQLDTQEEVDEFIEENIKEAEKLVKNATRPAPKMGTDIAKYKEEKAKWQEEQAKLADMQKRLDYWKSVKAEMARLQGVQEDVQSAKAEKDDLAPRSAMEYVASMINRIDPESYRRETGYGVKEQRKAGPIFLKKENGGMTIEQLAEYICEQPEAEEFGITLGMDAEVRNMILDVLAYGSSKAYIREAHKEQNRKDEEGAINALDMMAQELGFASAEDMMAHDEVFLIEAIRAHYGLEDSGFYDNLAEEYEKEDSYGQGNERQGDGTSAERPEEGDTTGTGQNDSEGGSVLSEEQSADSTRTGGDSTGQTSEPGGSAEGGVAGSSEGEAVQGEQGDVIQEPRFTEEVLENGDKRITNYNSRGEIEAISVERDGKIVSVDSYDEGVLFEHTEYDENGVSTAVTRYGKDGKVVAEHRFDSEEKKLNNLLDELKAKLGGLNKNNAPQYATALYELQKWSSLEEANEALKYLEKNYFEKGFTLGVLPFLDTAQELINKKESLRKRVKEWEKVLGVKVNIIDSFREVKNKAAIEEIKSGASVKGWYATKSNEVYIYMPHNTSESDIDMTMIHEVVAHKGLKELLGDKTFDKLCDKVWDAMPKQARDEYLNYVGGVEGDTEAQRAAADEYIAHLAETIDKGELSEAEKTVWQSIVDFIKKLLFDKGMKITDEQIVALIKASYANMAQRSKAEGKQMFRKDTKDLLEYARMDVARREAENEGVRFSKTLEEVNNRFNARLLELDKDREQKDRVLRLGRPSGFLLDGGVVDADIEMEFDKFVRKSSDKYENEHPFTANDIMNLPIAINYPIAVFDSTNGRDKVVLTELKKDGRNFVVAIKAVPRKRKGGIILEVNDIATLYPKKAKGIVNWINKGYSANIDKKKALEWLEALRNHHGTELNTQELDSATKIIEDFENPKLLEENEETRFSKTRNSNNLVAVHNISESNLRKVLEMGGLIMPSIAITDVNLGHSGYGEISLLFDKETINPSDSRNKVYGGDAWTPRFPQMVPKLNGEVVRSVRKKIEGLLDENLRAKYSLSAELHPSNIESTISNNGVEGYYGKEWMKIAYLLDNGKRFKIPMKMKDYGSMAETIIKLAKDWGLSLSDIRNGGYEFYEKNPEFVSAVLDAKNEARLVSVSAEDRDKVRDLLRNRPMRFSAFDTYISQAIDMERDLNNGGLKQVVDGMALYEAINKRVKTDNAEYNKWVDDLFEGVVEKYGIRNNKDWYTPSGNSRPFEQLYDAPTPANILRYMLAQNDQGGSGGLWDSNIMGASAETYESIEEIREKGKKRLHKVSEDVYDEWATSVANRFSEICDEFMTASQKNDFGGIIDAKIAITNAVAKDKTAKGIYKTMKNQYANFTMEHAKRVEEIVKEIQDYAIGYFEAKPQRIVPLSEVRKAVVPSNVSSDIVEGLEKNGVEVATYRKGNEQSRNRVVKKESDGIRFRKKLAEIKAEEAEIERKAKEDGTWMKAPNGQPSKLNERQWVQVRTKAFKKWFGDWEKAFRIEKLRKSKSVDVDFNNEYELNRDSAKEWMKNNLRGEYRNADTGEKIVISKVGINEVTSHGSKDVAHLKSLSVIPQMIEQSVFIDEIPNTKEHEKYDSYRYYVCGLKIDGVDYTAKVVVGVKDGNKYYDHRLTEIEKGTLIDNLNGLSNSVAENQNAFVSVGKDSKLLSILQTNSSKVVDENGEPLVVIHNTTIPNITIFKPGIANSIYFADKGGQQFVGGFERGEYNYECFLNIRKPTFDTEWTGDEDSDGLMVRLSKQQIIDNTESEEEKTKALKVLEDGDYAGFFAVSNPNQIKSATDNIGTFDEAEDDIRFRFIGRKGAESLDKAEEATTRLDNLNVAREMENADKDTKAIKLATGWERGADGKWRYETEDVDIILTPYEKYQSLKREYNRIANEKDRVGYALNALAYKRGLTDEQKARKKELNKKWKELYKKESEARDLMFDFDRNRVMTLGEVVGLDDELMKAYPELADVSVSFSLDSRKHDAGVNGDYDHKTRTIWISPWIEDTRSVLVHEIQHAIQDIEGFAKGGNDMMADPEKVERRDRMVNEFDKEIAEVRKNATAMLKQIEEAEKSLENEQDEEKRDAIESRIMNLRMDVDSESAYLEEMYQRRNELEEKDVTLGYDGYKRLGGEVESRNVQNRLDMSPAERRASLASETEDVAREDQIILKLGLGLNNVQDMNDTNDLLEYARRDVERREKGNVELDKDASGTKQDSSTARDSKQGEGNNGKELDNPSSRKVTPGFDALAYAQQKVAEQEEEKTRLRKMVVELDKAEARREYEQTLESNAYRFQEAWQDSMLGLKALQDAVMKANGRTSIADWEDAYMAENQLSSINNAEQEAWRRIVFGEVLKEVKALMEKGLKREDISDYLMAKHGIERNTIFASRDAMAAATDEKGNFDAAVYQSEYAENRKRDYSGLTTLFDTDKEDVADAENKARIFVTDIEKRFTTDNLWKAINKATQSVLDKQLQSGLITKDMHDELSNRFSYYVPLRGFEETTSDEVYDYLSYSKGAFSSPIKNARGRSSVADDPIATLANMAESGIVHGNKNIMKQRFLLFVENNPSDLVSIDDVWVRYGGKDTEGNPIWLLQSPAYTADMTKEEMEQERERFEADMEAQRMMNPDMVKRGREAEDVPYRVVSSKNEQEHRVIVKRNGKTYVLTINGNPRAAQAINGLTNPETTDNALIKFGEHVNRYLSSVFTSRNPAFIFANLVRDGIYANQTIWAKESPAYAIKYNNNWAKAFSSIANLIKLYKENNLDMNNTEHKMFYDFIMNGGETGYTMLKSVDDYKDYISKELGTKRRNPLELIDRNLDTFNRWAEGISRYAAFKTSREMGRSIQRSIYDAKEISVNFNKKGAGASVSTKWDSKNVFSKNNLQYLNAWGSQLAREAYVFWNAGVQGLTNFGKIAVKNKGKFMTMAGGNFVIGMLMPMVNSLLAGLAGDDEDDYWNIPEYIRRNNFCLYVGGGYLKIPLPIELRAIYGLGELCAGHILGKSKDKGTDLARKVLEQVSQVLPIDLMEGGGSFTPTAFKPLVEIWANEDWTGMPIQKETDYNKNMPEWTKAYKNSNKALVSMAEALSDWTGGNDYKPGAVNISPAKVEHLIEGYLGGIGTLASQLYKTVSLPFDKDMQESWEFGRNAPIFNRFFTTGDGRTKEKSVTNEWFEHKEDMDIVKQQFNGFRKDMKTNDVVKYAEAQAELDKLKETDGFAQYLIWYSKDKELNKVREALKMDPGNEALKARQLEIQMDMNNIFSKAE